jgi:hypothetical protein
MSKKSTIFSTWKWRQQQAGLLRKNNNSHKKQHKQKLPNKKWFFSYLEIKHLRKLFEDALPVIFVTTLQLLIVPLHLLLHHLVRYVIATPNKRRIELGYGTTRPGNFKPLRSRTRKHKSTKEADLSLSSLLITD